MDKGRIEAFSDGVIAVAITLLALNLHVVRGQGSLAHQLGSQWPNYAAFVVSFLTIGIIWINHHAMLRRLAVVDHTILLLNLLLLMTICVLPFTTAIMAEYLTAAHGNGRLAAVVYAGSLLAMALTFFAIQWYVFEAEEPLLEEYLKPEARRRVLRRNAVGLLPYAVATAAGAVTPYVTLGICAVVGVFYAHPGTTKP